MCAAKPVKHNGGTTTREVAVFDSFRQHEDNHHLRHRGRLPRLACVGEVVAMESTSQQQLPQPCECQQQLRYSLPWLGIALVIIVGFNHWAIRRRKNTEESSSTPATGGTINGDKT